MLFDAKDLDSCLAELSFNMTMQPPHSAKRTTEWLERYRWDIIPHPSHSPDLASSDFHRFGLLKRHLRGKKFEDEDELIGEECDWFLKLDANSLLPRWQKCIALQGDYIEKKPINLSFPCVSFMLVN
ncbi:histone-lysine N-methyltransferase SETMAR [Plakobranchus ocellatus]|uniref:Histone-lysine N-methyltransferase SETMAR n=1 Tax=Plakobranchus ocellatus TaxID=259542 RepID=A0AAV4B366_9GAST|nr:histone-lysine N-methyltransferase SETMAR [Plakobranchus ocellatus]